MRVDVFHLPFACRLALGNQVGALQGGEEQFTGARAPAVGRGESHGDAQAREDSLREVGPVVAGVVDHEARRPVAELLVGLELGDELLHEDGEYLFIRVDLRAC